MLKLLKFKKKQYVWALTEHLSDTLRGNRAFQWKKRIMYKSLVASWLGQFCENFEITREIIPLLPSGPCDYIHLAIICFPTRVLHNLIMLMECKWNLCGFYHVLVFQSPVPAPSSTKTRKRRNKKEKKEIAEGNVKAGYTWRLFWRGLTWPFC